MCRGESLCEGEGSDAIRRALDEGRIYDFFCIVDHVLRNYNPDSAYVQIEDWNGISCKACGDNVDEDDAVGCCKCETELCLDCSTMCESCVDRFCSECISSCDGCGDDACQMCLKSCDDCGDSFCNTCLFEGTCDDCITKQNEANEEDRRKSRTSGRCGSHHTRWQSCCTCVTSAPPKSAVSASPTPAICCWSKTFNWSNKSAQSSQSNSTTTALPTFFDQQVDAGRQPEQFARVWIHTHPGASPSPSGTDEETFERCFGGVDWAVMHIIAEEGNTYTRARFNVGPGTERRLRSRVEFDREFPAADHEAWFIEYCDNVTVYDPFSSRHTFADTYYESDWWENAPSAADRWSDSLLEAVG